MLRLEQCLYVLVHHSWFPPLSERASFTLVRTCASSTLALAELPEVGPEPCHVGSLPHVPASCCCFLSFFFSNIHFLISWLLVGATEATPESVIAAQLVHGLGATRHDHVVIMWVSRRPDHETTRRARTEHA